MITTITRVTVSRITFSGVHNTSIMSIPDECYSRNGYPGNSGDHKASIMSIPDECYSRNGYTGNSGYHKLQ
jgi:uncharacterized protein YjhX (UPF0386 family)